METTENMLRDYLRDRGFETILPPSTAWTGVDQEEEDSTNAVAFLSHLLTYPLTLSYIMSSRLPLVQNDRPQKIAIVGARSESTLPSVYWKELVVSQQRRQQPSIELDFVGPEVMKRSNAVPRQTTTTVDDESSLVMPPTFVYSPNYLTDIPGDRLKEYDTIVLFNPGLGHPHLKEGWSQSLEVLKSLASTNNANVNLFTTCHSNYDMERDVEVLSQYFSPDCLEVRINPFASRRGDVDVNRNKSSGDEGGGDLVNANSHIICIKTNTA
jgi:hypothetical protein